jgi:hypothetical protein
MRCIVDGLFRIRLREVGESDLTSNTGLLLVLIGERGLARDGLLRG